MGWIGAPLVLLMAVASGCSSARRGDDFDAGRAAACPALPCEILPSRDVEIEIGGQSPDVGGHWDKVDDPIPDGDATHLASASGAIERDLFGHVGTGLPSGTAIGAVSVLVVQRREGPGEVEIQPRLRVGPLEETPEKCTTTEDYTECAHRWPTNFVRDEPWTVEDVDRLSFGVRAGLPHEVEVRITQVRLRIEPP